MMIRVTLLSLCFVMAFSIVAISANTEPSSFRLRANHQLQTDWNDADIKAEIVLGRKVASRILGQYPRYKNKKSQRYVQLLGKGVSEIIGRPELTYYFTVLDSEHVNAYATPGGYIFITKGLLKKCKNEAQLIGVLSHEISHVNRRYIVKKYDIRGNQSSLLSYTRIIAGGSTQTARLSLTMILDKIMDSLLTEGLDKEEELAADKEAIIYMSQLNYNPLSYQQLITDLGSHTNKRSVSHTHPKNSERLHNINSAFSTVESKGTLLRKRRFDHYVKL